MRPLQRRGPQAPVRTDGAEGRPVLLATLDVPFDHNAVVFAGYELIILWLNSVSPE
jgi:hypothetical protein